MIEVCSSITPSWAIKLVDPLAAQQRDDGGVKGEVLLGDRRGIAGLVRRHQILQCRPHRGEFLGGARLAGRGEFQRQPCAVQLGEVVLRGIHDRRPVVHGVPDQAAGLQHAHGFAHRVTRNPQRCSDRAFPDGRPRRHLAAHDGITEPVCHLLRGTGATQRQVLYRVHGTTIDDCAQSLYCSTVEQS
jgi:hypothetical protein